MVPSNRRATPPGAERPRPIGCVRVESGLENRRRFTQPLGPIRPDWADLCRKVAVNAGLGERQGMGTKTGKLFRVAGFLMTEEEWSALDEPLRFELEEACAVESTAFVPRAQAPWSRRDRGRVAGLC